jgi:hypothetical protein
LGRILAAELGFLLLVEIVASNEPVSPELAGAVAITKPASAWHLAKGIPELSQVSA